MIFVDHAFEESPSRTTEPASYEQPAEEQGTSLARSSEESANDATQGGNTASDRHFQNLRHTGSQKLPGAPGAKQDTNMEDFATVLETFEEAQPEAMTAVQTTVPP